MVIDCSMLDRLGRTAIGRKEQTTESMHSNTSTQLTALGAQHSAFNNGDTRCLCTSAVQFHCIMC
jgi:hypothetical protein